MEDDQPIPFIRERNKSRRYSKGRRVSTESTSSTDSLSVRSSTSSSSLQFSYSVNSQSESMAIKERAFAKMERNQEELQRVRFRQLKMNSHSEPSLMKVQQRLSLDQIERETVRQLRDKFENLTAEQQVELNLARGRGWRLQQSKLEVNPSIDEAASEDEVDDWLSDDEFEPALGVVETPPPPPPASSPPILSPVLSRESSKNEEIVATNSVVINKFVVGGDETDVDSVKDGEATQEVDALPLEPMVSAESSDIVNSAFPKRGPDFPRNYRSTPRPKTEIIGTTKNQVTNKYKSYHHQGEEEEDEDEEAVLREKNDKIAMEHVQPILDELIKTEETYVENLRMGINNYGNIFTRKDLPLGLRGKKFVLLGNVEQIAEFHRDEFLPMLLRNKDNLKRLFDEFTLFIEENCFYGYVLFTMNKKRSLKLCETYKDYFKRLQSEIDDKLGINSFLVQPIQRMARYPLLLQQFITKLFKHCDFHSKPVIEACCRLEKRIRTLLTMTNESEVINDIVECNDFNVFYQGKFRKVSDFYVFDHTLKRGYRSKVFIFDKCIIYTEIKDKRLIFRGCYPCERIGIVAKPKALTLFYQKRKTQECDFNADQAQCEHWIDLITEMISSFATEERRKLKEKYSKENDHAHRRPPSLSLFRNSNRFSSDSGIGNMWTLPKATDENRAEDNSNRTTWYATS